MKAAVPLAAARHPLGSALRRWLGGRDAALAALNFVLLVAVALKFPSFVAPGNIADILDDTAILFLLALAEMLVILTGAIDLSVAANLALTGVVVALVNAAYPELGVAPIMALALVVGTALGAGNAILVWKLRLPSIVVTLGTLAIYRGCIFLLTGGAWVNSNQMSDTFLNFIRVRFLGLTTLTWIAILGILGAGLFLTFSVAGRNLYATGGNKLAATYAGIDPGRMQALAFLISGAVSGLCGYFWVSRFAVAYVEVAQGFELQAIAACVIGGVSIAGGLGTVPGVVLGALFLGIVKNALPLIGISPFWQMAIAGAVITVAVIINARGEGRARARRILKEKTA
jgi:rhamnose transport system permease protein